MVLKLFDVVVQDGGIFLRDVEYSLKGAFSTLRQLCNSNSLGYDSTSEDASSANPWRLNQ